ncbi:hypothetical protein C8A03DRAFT_38710 [Achaetomium macrosporum]|uniref:Protein kinase domain-containing protein n=1 Tax=Achaetomium macrosporum TaxID=79813 RepID=A0AAN7HA97_9PEZI|nr:hypothetical protein C8A03DRAFT_38710 [Achaetomium macrosporum]
MASKSDNKPLYYRLEASMVSKHDLTRFLPKGQLKTVLSEAAVIRELEAGHYNLDQKDVKDFASFLSRSAPRTFATLCMGGHQHLVPLFRQAEFEDKNLPIDRNKLKEILEKVVEDASLDGQLLHSLPGVINSFSMNQWLFTAQSFHTDTFTYPELEHGMRLPFLNWDHPIYSGPFSTVWEKVLHKDHLTLGQRHRAMKFKVPMKKTDQGEEHPWLALKELKPATEAVRKITGTDKSEADILEIMNGLCHPHLLQTIAHYRWNDKEYFLFPWAEGGSLRKYWKETTPNPTPEYVEWLVVQMAGLADAISKLHARNCRHGDLKPDNILCFGRQNDATGNMPPERLVIADLGLARIHDFITALRENIATNTKAGTMMYSPPEYLQGGDAPWSRLFDIWSLGCIYLEFIVWLLRGSNGLLEFSRSVAPKDSERNTFYTIIGGYGTTEQKLAVHPAVTQCIDSILNDSRCGNSTALRRLVRLIADEMVVVALPPDGAADGREKAQAYEEMERRSSSELSQTAGPFTLRLQAATTIEPQDKTRVRATAGVVHSKLTKLLFEMKAGITAAMGNSTSPHETNQQLPTRPTPGTPADHRVRDSLNVPRNHEEQLVASLYRTRFVHHSQDVQLGFPNLPAPGSSLHMKLLSLWISACDRDHTCFRGPSGFFPTRVIDVGEPRLNQQFHNSVVRLVYQTGDIDRSSRYLALSHRWGPPPPPAPPGSNEENDMVRTTVKDDLIIPGQQQRDQQGQGQPVQEEERKERIIALSRLPRTFRDAVIVTRGLGFRYLWIDSLCIVQDDACDWHRESQLMEHVYSSAYCTIAAIRASGADDGFLAPSKGVVREERGVVVMRGEGEEGGEGESEFYVCEMLDDFDEHVGRSELQRRGWVLQERALSRRTIHFTERQTYWECGKGVRCETLTRMHNDKAAFLGDNNFPNYADAHSKGKRIKLIQGLYEQYSAMQLTYARDRPAAIRGLEARLVQTIGGPGGYGIFRRHMHRYLLWKRHGETGLKRITDFPPDERVPSWSWMAHNGEIKYIDVPGVSVEWDKNLTWPCSDSDPVPFRLEAPVRDVSQLRAEDITLDDGRPMTTQAPKCVVVGTIGGGANVSGGYAKYCYVLIVEPVAPPVDGSESGKVWQRLGVGRLKRRHIVFEPEGRGLDLNWIV